MKKQKPNLQYSYKKSFIVSFVLATLILVSTVVVCIIGLVLPTPQPHKIDLAYFSGEILPINKVHPGTFRLMNVKYEEIKNWGKNSVLSFSANYHTITLRAWRQDPERSFAVNYVYKTFPIPWSIFFGVNTIKEKGGVLYAIPHRETFYIIMFGCISVAGSILAMYLSYPPDNKTWSLKRCKK